LAAPPATGIYGVAGEQMKRDIASGKFDDVVREVEDDIGRGAQAASL
jgi:hypothetical protein